MNSIEPNSMNLKTFIVKEELHADHAVRFLTFQDRYHHEVFLDLKKTLEKAWTKESATLNNKFKAKPDDIDFAILQNPSSTTKITVESNSEKITSARYRDTVTSSISVKIPLILSLEERDLIIKRLLEVSLACFKDITHKWSEIFKIEDDGKAVPCFKILNDHHEIRLQFVLSKGSDEMYKTLYSIRVEYGKSNSKLKDFDRLYLVTLL